MKWLSIPPGKDPDGAVTAFRLDASLIDRDPVAAERVSCGPRRSISFSYFNNVDTPRRFFCRRNCLASRRQDEGRAELERARDVFATALKEAPEVAERHAFLGLTCALLGEKEQAICRRKKAVELRPETEDALDGTLLNAVLAVIYARVGEKERALEFA